MNTQSLCPSKKNQLGKGMFSPDTEAALVAEGYIFACRLPTRTVGALLVCKRPIADAVTDGEMDDPRSRVTR